jgi:hypothetical protein
MFLFWGVTEVEDGIVSSETKLVGFFCLLTPVASVRSRSKSSIIAFSGGTLSLPEEEIMEEHCHKTVPSSEQAFVWCLPVV